MRAALDISVPGDVSINREWQKRDPVGFLRHILELEAQVVVTLRVIWIPDSIHSAAGRLPELPDLSLDDEEPATQELHLDHEDPQVILK